MADEIDTPQDVQRTADRNEAVKRLLEAAPVLMAAGKGSGALSNTDRDTRLRRLERAVAALIQVTLGQPSGGDLP